MARTPDWTITPVPLARLPVPGWECLFGKNDCALRELVFWLWILESEAGIGLIDAGLPHGDALESLNRANQTLDAASVFSIENTFEQALRSAGLQPGAIDFVLITQLITYCTGGLLADNLPRARVYCAWDGMRELLLDSPGHPRREFYFTAESWAFLRELLIAERIVFVREPVEVAPGVVFGPTGGHHPGSAGVRICTARGTVGILETAFIQENIEREIPIGIAEDAARCREAIRGFKRDCDLVVAGHDPAAGRLVENFLSSP